MHFLYDGTIQGYDSDRFVEVMGLVGAKEFGEFQHDFQTIPVRWAVTDTEAIRINSTEKLNEAKELSQSGTTLRWFQLTEEKWSVAAILLALVPGMGAVSYLKRNFSHPELYSTHYREIIQVLSHAKKRYQDQTGFKRAPHGALGVLEIYPRSHSQELWISTNRDLLFDKIAQIVNAGNTGEVFVVEPDILAFVMRTIFPTKPAESTSATPAHAS